MSTPVLRNYSVAVAAALLIVPAYFASRPAVLPPADAAELASRFKFTITPLPEIPGQQRSEERRVGKECA